MAFDITPYIDKKPSEVRKLIREGVIDFPTAGMCRGYAQANLIILPPEYAGDFEEFARRNPFPCPILEIVRGTPETHNMGEGGMDMPMEDMPMEDMPMEDMPAEGMDMMPEESISGETGEMPGEDAAAAETVSTEGGVG